MMWLPNPLSLYHKEGFLVSKDFYSTASSGGLFALKLTKRKNTSKRSVFLMVAGAGFEPTTFGL